MANLVVQPAEIKNIRDHPNADRLLISEILGYQTIIGKDNEYKEGQVVVFVPPDTLVPRSLAEELEVVNYLSSVQEEPGYLRVRTTRLRGEFSMGLTFPIPNGENWEVGQDVGEFLGLKKYNPPLRAQAGDSERNHPLFPAYTEIENLRNFPDIFNDGEEVVIQEKLNGTNGRVGIIETQYMAGSRGLRRRMPDNQEDFHSNTYWFPFTIKPVESLLNALHDGTHNEDKHNTVILFGEIYGSPVNKFHYGFKGKLGFRAFDLMINEQYVDFDEFERVCKKFGVEIAPVLYRGPFSLDVVKEHSSGKTTLEDNHLREGVVVQSVKEKTHPVVIRHKLKFINDEILYKKSEGKIEDTTDL